MSAAPQGTPVATERDDALLDGLAVVVTGAGRGMGRACVLDLAALGARIVVNDVDVASADATAAAVLDAGGSAVSHPADIADAAAADGLIARCVAEHGRIDGLVNNAALLVNGTIDDYDADVFRRLLSVNVVGLANCAVAALRPMLEQGAGSVVNVTSGAHLGMEHFGLYGASKGAVASLTYTWAIETAGRGVRVNAVSPWAAGGMTAQVDRYWLDRGLTQEPQYAPDPSTNSPLIAYLLCPMSAGVTGQVVRIQERQLSLMSHPAVMRPVLERESWDVGAVRRAFDEVLAARQAPVGIAYGDPATHAAPKAVPLA